VKVVGNWKLNIWVSQRDPNKVGYCFISISSYDDCEDILIESADL